MPYTFPRPWPVRRSSTPFPDPMPTGGPRSILPVKVPHPTKPQMQDVRCGSLGEVILFPRGAASPPVGRGTLRELVTFSPVRVQRSSGLPSPARGAQPQKSNSGASSYTPVPKGLSQLTGRSLGRTGVGVHYGPPRRDFYTPERLGTGLGGPELPRVVPVPVYIFRARSKCLRRPPQH